MVLISWNLHNATSDMNGEAYLTALSDGLAECIGSQKVVIITFQELMGTETDSNLDGWNTWLLALSDRLEISLKKTFYKANDVVFVGGPSSRPEWIGVIVMSVHNAPAITSEAREIDVERGIQAPLKKEVNRLVREEAERQASRPRRSCVKAYNEAEEERKVAERLGYRTDDWYRKVALFNIEVTKNPFILASAHLPGPEFTSNSDTIFNTYLNAMTEANIVLGDFNTESLNTTINTLAELKSQPTTIGQHPKRYDRCFTNKNKQILISPKTKVLSPPLFDEGRMRGCCTSDHCIIAVRD